MARWIKKWIWNEPHDLRGNTIVGTDADREGVLVGYGTWQHVEAFGEVLQPRHIEIAWFGVHSDYQSQVDDAGHGIAGRLYATVENDASHHQDSTPGMPFTLTCHVDNDRGLRFWKRRGYEIIPDPRLELEDEIYYRLVRKALP